MPRLRGRAIVDSPEKLAEVITTTLTFAMLVISAEANLRDRLPSEERGPHPHMARNLALLPLTQIVRRQCRKHWPAREVVHQGQDAIRLEHHVVVHEHQPRRVATHLALIPCASDRFDSATVARPRLTDNAVYD